MKKTIHISGMHCVSCEILLEKELKEIKGIKKFKVSHKKGTLELEDKKVPFQEIENAIETCGYEIVDENSKPKKQKLSMSDFWQIGLIFIALFLTFSVISKLEISRFFPDTSEDVSFMLAFLLGIVASVSTCLALTGGIVMSFSSEYSVKKDSVLHRALPQIYFHIGRIGGFGLLGGLLGAIGGKFNYSVSFTGYLTIFVGLVMFYMGLHILNIVPNITSLGFHLPKKLSSGIHNLQKKEHPFVPAIIGALTFFLPCGFTQSMQLAAVASGSFWTGALIMIIFALGTFPVLFSVGLGSSYAQDKDFGFFKKIIGVIIIFFSLYSFNSGLVLSGSSFTINFWNRQTAQESVIMENEDTEIVNQKSVQTIRMDIDYSFKQTEFKIKKGIPVRFEINAINTTGCSDEVIIPRLGLTTGKLKSGITVLEFTPEKSGILPFSCWMGMQSGRFIVE